MFKRVIRGGLLLTLLLLVGTSELRAQSSVSFLPNGSLTGVTSSGSSTTFSTPILLSNGSAAAPSLAFASDVTTGIHWPSANQLSFDFAGFAMIGLSAGSLQMRSDKAISFADGANPFGTQDVVLRRDAANTLALRNSTAAQTFNIYNTYTDASNYERGFIRWNGNVLQIGTEAAGTGTLRPISLVPGDTTIITSTVRASATDTYTIGLDSRQYTNGYFSRSIQGSKSKTLTDNTPTSFVRIAVADDDYEAGRLIYTAYAEDADGDARQVRQGSISFSMLNNSGTEACGLGSDAASGVVSTGTFTCSITCGSVVADTIDLQATCDTSLDAAAETLTIEWRLDLQSPATITPQ